jgi:hypothetical protein
MCYTPSFFCFTTPTANSKFPFTTLVELSYQEGIRYGSFQASVDVSHWCRYFP